MEFFLSGFFLSISLCLDLGMVNVAMIRTGVERGFVPALFLGLGSGIGDLIYAALSMVGISLLLEQVVIRWILWIGGTLILLYLTYNMFREVARPKQLDLDAGEKGSTGRSPLKNLMSGIGLALASPSAILWFATVGGSIIAANHAVDELSLPLFFFGFFVAGLVWSFAVALVSSQGGKLLGPRLIRGFSLLSALLFLYFAAKVFWNGYQTLI
ncbi:LysE family translocator [Brevibacillus fluminis]|uniref:LysE family translocator n=1 Tax=Brevibacillus fluminis TaxID=511487 RepID=UPI003F8BA83D